MIPSQAYFDVRTLTPQLKGAEPRCPVTGCTTAMDRTPSSWGLLPLCPVHRIRIHAGSGTFVYYHGQESSAKRAAALRNIVFEPDFFEAYFLGNAQKAESHRICHETSEDALTWNVFSRLVDTDVLTRLASDLTNTSLRNRLELYLWGLRVDLQQRSAPTTFAPLAAAREVFEPDVVQYRTEPDIMLYVPGQLLVLVEAKLTSGNPIAKESGDVEVVGAKPKSREGILRRYSPAALPNAAVATNPAAHPFYSQLYRNLVFAIYMAHQLDVPWAVMNLVSDGHRGRQGRQAEYADPTGFMQSLIPEESRSRFRAYSWERLYGDYVATTTALTDLAEYMANKSAYCAKVFAI